jgi:16S rRNA (uracil1498-N3)-methyltransferase
MRLTRCFVPSPLAAGSALTLPGLASTHIAKVLRLRAGAALTLFDGRGGEFEAQVEALDRSGVRVRVGAHRAIERESPVAVTLLQCLARGERMDLIVQKATELGASAIVPVVSEHSVVRLDAASAQRRQLHWQAIAISACEQCGRNRIPSLRPTLDFEPACAVPGPATARLLLLPAAACTLADTLRERAAAAAALSLSLLIGPESGLSQPEIGHALQQGFIGCSLGPRVLRAETAPLAALAVVQTLLGDFAARAAATN